MVEKPEMILSCVTVASLALTEILALGLWSVI